MKYFVKNIIQIYGREYLWPPHEAEIKVILQEYKDQGFPRCVGSRKLCSGHEKLPIALGRPVQRERNNSNNGLRGHSQPEPLHLACILWHPQCPQH